MLPGFGIFFSGFARSGEGNKIDLILQSPLEFDRPDDRCDSRICLTLLNLLDNAPRSIDFAIYRSRHQIALRQAILRAKRRGYLTEVT